MKSLFSYAAMNSVLLVLLYGCGGGGSTSTSGGGGTSGPTTNTTYYVDCSASSSGSGTQASPWNTLSSVNSTTFGAGDEILLKRGTTCNGILDPQGSGSSGSPIVIDAYGTGAVPIISAGSNTAGLELSNQQYWEINDLEITGGYKYGVYITGNTASSTLNHIYLSNLNVHGASYQSVLRADSGEVVISTSGTGEVLSDVVLNGVVAHDSEVSEGILISAGGAYTGTDGASQTLGSNVTVENSTVYNVYGDGILIMELSNGLLENNVVYNSGQCTSCTGSTPGGLWEWYCHTCTVENNESYSNHSWAGDGGDFDIDYYNNSNIVEYNYGHDADGYCVAMFGSEDTASVGNVIRYNICANNAQKSAYSSQGDVFLSTWSGGLLNGMEIYNNTFYWNPAANAPLLNTTSATFTGTNPNFFENNIVYSTVAGMVKTSSALTLNNNIYWSTGSATPTWIYNGTTYSGFAAYQTGSGQDASSYYTDPLLNNPTYHSTGKSTTAFTQQTGSPAHGKGTDVCTGISGCSMGTQDFFGNTVSSSGSIDIGAEQAP
ncbi:MAG: right-handed parallel beta-helix repeat-containing protein [Terracidiphilus sp.]